MNKMMRMQSVRLSAMVLALVLVGTIARAEAEAEKKPAWETSAAAGLTLTKGNSDTLLATVSLTTQKKGTANEWAFGVSGAYGENDGNKNNETLQGFGQYNRLFNERWFGYLRADALHDDIANLDYRVSLSPGIGYYVIKSDRTTLALELGPGYVFEKQGGERNDYLTLRVAERFEHKLNDRVRIWQSAEFLPEVERFSNYIINAELGIESALTKKLSLRSYLQNTYDNEPAPGSKKNDLKLVTGLAYKF
jgi:putative salt-induced outer membrane protein YdiY